MLTLVKIDIVELIESHSRFDFHFHRFLIWSQLILNAFRIFDSIFFSSLKISLKITANILLTYAIEMPL